MIELDQAKWILANTYLDIVNNPKKYKVSYTHTETPDEKRVMGIKEKYKNDTGKKLGRNDLCVCGSGKKFKKCCGGKQ